MAYCLGNLVGILEQLLHPDQHHKTLILDHDKVPQIQSLLEEACFLRDFLANSAPLVQARVESLEDRIRDAADNAEDILESHFTSRMLSGQTTISPPDLCEVIKVFESAKEELIKITDDESQRPEQDLVKKMDNQSSARRVPNHKNLVVGVGEDLNHLRVRLTQRSSNFEIIPIVGMGGIGKTTLARILYDEYSSSNSSHFDVCAWATVSQEHSAQEILLSLIGCIPKSPTKLVLEQEANGLSLHNLIVLDDIWSSKAWDDVQKFFPNDNRGSRIILTTRGNEVANYVNSKSHVMHLISERDSWELLKKKVFGEELCPCELEEVGKKLANKCRGLPLAVQLIGGILSQTERSVDFWEQVSSSVSSSLENAGDQFSRIFSLSYVHLPHYLKPCFLYMGAFPEDYEIPASKLVKLWVAEGFLNPIGERSLEEAAKVYLSALVDRNLIFVCQRKGSTGEVKSYSIHDLLRDQCQNKAREMKFLNVKNSRVDNFSKDLFCTRRVIVHTGYCESIALDTDMVGQILLARSFICIGDAVKDHLSPAFFALSLLRVLDVLEITFPEFPEEILKLVNLRYLAFRLFFHVPESITILQNLQSLVVEFGVYFEWMAHYSARIFGLPQLRHIKLFGMLPPSPLQLDTSPALQENLQSLSSIPVHKLTHFVGKFPNLMQLGIHGETTTDNVDLTCYHKLETLKCSAAMTRNTNCYLSKLIFPDSLKKLVLKGGTISQTCMRAIGALSNLETLKLEYCFMESSTWEPSEGAFCKLQYLKLARFELEDWMADETHFPELRHLIINRCINLKAIPLEIGGINTLEIIEVDAFNTCVLESARRIIKEQGELGNNLLQLFVRGSWI